MVTGSSRLQLVAIASAAVIACGKSGPPLPPLVRLPSPPAELAAVRHGDSVDVNFLVPLANTDGSRPANITRVDVYAYTGPANLSDDEVARLGTRVGSIEVKAPRDPNATVDPDEPLSDVAAPEGSGLDQGAPGSLSETLTASAITPVERPRARDAEDFVPVLPLAGAPSEPPTRFYAGVGITTRGRRGPFSRRAGVPLVEPPSPLGAPTVTYDETTITVTWTPGGSVSAVNPSSTETVLPSRSLGPDPPTLAFNVYDMKPKAPETSTPSGGMRLTKAPIAETRFEDTRIEWGEERCYVVRVVRTVNALSVESDASPAVCRTLQDTFPPKPPAGVQHIPSTGAVNLTWDQNSEKDLAGYLVLRGTQLSGPLEPLTPSPISNSSYTDSVPSGGRFVYAVQAVDRAGNVSRESQRIEETAR